MRGDEQDQWRRDRRRMNSEKTENVNGEVEMFDSFGGQLALAPAPVNNTLNK